MTCPYCKNTAITGMLHGCYIIQQHNADHRAAKNKTNNFILRSEDRELDRLISEVSENVEY